MLLRHITNRLQLQNFSRFSPNSFLFSSFSEEQGFLLMRATQVRWISGCCRRDISGRAVCYMFNIHTCASEMTRVNNVSDFSFVVCDGSGFLTCPWISAVLNSLESNRAVVATLYRHWVTDHKVVISNPCTAKLPLLSPSRKVRCVSVWQTL